MILCSWITNQFLGNNGLPAVKYRLFTYLAATTTKTPTYVDAGGSAQNTNPIVLDYRGECQLWLDPAVTYKFVLAFPGFDDPPTNPIRVVDNVPASMAQSVFNTLLAGSDPFKRSAAEIAASVTPTSYVFLNDDETGYVDPRRYGVDLTGVSNSQAAMNNAISVLRKTTHHRLFIPQGIIKVTDLNLCDAYAMSSAAAPDFNNGLTIFGTGKTQSKLVISAAVNNAGVGIHTVGVARAEVKGIWFDADNGSSPKALFLQAKGLQSGAIVFSGLMTYIDCKFTSYGDYSVFNQGAEQIDYIGCEFDNVSASGYPLTLSIANTAGITSIYAPLMAGSTPGASTTMASLSGAGNGIQAYGPAAVLLDNGVYGIGTFTFGTTYFNLRGATTAAFKDTGGVGSKLVDIKADNIQVEFNGGAGTNQVTVLVSAAVWNSAFSGYSAYSVAQTVPLFANSGAWSDPRIDWVINSIGSPAAPATVLQHNLGITGGNIRIDAARSTISILAASTSTELICTDGTYFLGEVKCEGLTTNAITFDLQRFPSGGSQTGNRDGGIRRQSTTGVSNAGVTVIYNGASYAELAVISGVDGGGGIWADLLMIAYNAFAVLSSNTQQGGVAARTYSVNNDGTLRLTTGTATLNNVTVQTFRTGGYGA